MAGRVHRGVVSGCLVDVFLGATDAVHGLNELGCTVGAQFAFVVAGVQVDFSTGNYSLEVRAVNLEEKRAVFDLHIIYAKGSVTEPLIFLGGDQCLCHAFQGGGSALDQVKDAVVSHDGTSFSR